MSFRRFIRVHETLVHATLLCCSLTPLAACGEDEDAESLVLDTREENYGKSTAEWLDDWIKHMHLYAPPECLDPLADTTGDACEASQTEDSPMLFLTGAFGGTFTRECTLPAGKPLLFPAIVVWADNAGVPESELLTQAELRDYVEQSYDNTDVDKLWARVDGRDVAEDDIERGGVRSAPYSVELPEGGNVYTCGGVENVSGTFDGYVSGYWVMLAPLPPGSHTVEFGVERSVDPITGDSFELNVTYELTIE